MYYKRTIKILSIGNSFSVNAQTYLYQIFKSIGFSSVTLGNLYIGGCSLNTHYTNAQLDLPNYDYYKNTTGTFINTENSTIKFALNDELWDIITFQQSSGQSGISESFENLKPLIEYVKANTSHNSYSLGWHMTWAYQGNSQHPDFTNYQSDQNIMYSKILECTKTCALSTSSFKYLFPVGTAIQNARTSYLGDRLTVDGFHLEDLGKFIAGLTWAFSITEESFEVMNYDLIPQKFIPYIDVIIESVNNAILNPFVCIKSQLIVDPRMAKTLVPFKVHKDIAYAKYSKQCLLDMYLPENLNKVIIHFHGGGLEFGSKDDDAHKIIGKVIAEAGIGFVSVNYRLYPNNCFPDFLVDGANAVKYVIDYLKTYHRDLKIFISGQSAGAYIAMMLAFDKKYLTSVGINPSTIAGWIIESGQPTTHYNVLSHRGCNQSDICVDEAAPLYYIHPDIDLNDILLISYTNDIPGRLTQNKLLYETIKQTNPQINIEFRMFEGEHCINSTTSYLGDYPHTNILLNFVQKL